VELLADTLIANLVKKPGNSPAFFIQRKVTSSKVAVLQLAVRGAR
jgi:hypothetical protein